MRVAVIGGGIAGLASGHYVLKARHQPVLLEAAGETGGSALPFLHEGTRLGRFPQLVQDNDSALIGLMAEHEALGRLAWREAPTRFLSNGREYSLQSPADLLRFGALNPLDRVRTAWATFRATRLWRFGLDLDCVPAREWLTELYGARVYQRLWAPYLRAKFGDSGDSIPAYWVYERMNREKNGRREVKGALRGGFDWLAGELASSLVKRGAEIRTFSPVTGIDAHGAGVAVEIDGRPEYFDAAISTLRLPELAKLARGRVASQLVDPGLEYQSLLSAVVIARSPLQTGFWTVIGDAELWFQGVCEETNVTPPEWCGGRHVAHLLRYTRFGSADWRLPDEQVRARARAAIASAFPAFDPGQLEAIHVLRQQDVQPVWPLGYLDRRPQTRVGDTRLYLCSDELAYPRIQTSPNTNVTLARETVFKLKGDS
jgi:protoporphyrinogen oxidase